MEGHRWHGDIAVALKGENAREVARTQGGGSRGFTLKAPSCSLRVVTLGGEDEKQSQEEYTVHLVRTEGLISNEFYSVPRS